MIVLRCVVVIAFLVARSSSVYAADTELVTIKPPDKEEKFWVGQRIPLFVELWAKGSFEGASSFSLPEIPQTILVKVGTPVVSSRNRDGDSWFVQTHEFALFTQASGKLTIPEFSVRFSNHDGFTGPVTDHDEKVPGTTIEVGSPPRRDSYGFLVTCDKVEITETWSPEPGKIKQGDIVTRTITQSASPMTGMALSPPVEQDIDGVRVYLSRPNVSDKTQRGDFIGTREDTIKYRFDQPGRVTIPEATYIWWNPDKKEYGSKTMPSVTFEIAAVAKPITSENVNKEREYWTICVLIAFGAALLGAFFYRPISTWLSNQWKALQRPNRVAARKLLHACHASNVRQVETAWAEWQSSYHRPLTLSDDLKMAIEDLHKSLYGGHSQDSWSGEVLARAFQKQLRQSSRQHSTSNPALPKLNPEI